MIYLAAILLGLSSSLHCLGMCGPLVMAIPLKNRSTFSLIANILQYNLGRITSYFLLGILIGAIGFSIQTFKSLQILSVIFGVFLILHALSKLTHKTILPNLKFNFTYKFISKYIGKILKSESPMKIFLLGALNGFLPCGMVYIALLNAILAKNVFESGFAMAIFGAGTLPVMFIVAYSATKFSQKIKQKISLLTPILVGVVGILIVLRGMNLGIPYISPEIKVSKTEKNMQSSKYSGEKEAVEMTCCHKK